MAPAAKPGGDDGYVVVVKRRTRGSKVATQGGKTKSKIGLTRSSGSKGKARRLAHASTPEASEDASQDATSTSGGPSKPSSARARDEASSRNELSLIDLMLQYHGVASSYWCGSDETPISVISWRSKPMTWESVGQARTKYPNLRFTAASPAVWREHNGERVFRLEDVNGQVHTYWTGAVKLKRGSKYSQVLKRTPLSPTLYYLSVTWLDAGVRECDADAHNSKMHTTNGNSSSSLISGGNAALLRSSPGLQSAASATHSGLDYAYWPKRIDTGFYYQFCIHGLATNGEVMVLYALENGSGAAYSLAQLQSMVADISNGVWGLMQPGRIYPLFMTTSNLDARSGWTKLGSVDGTGPWDFLLVGQNLQATCYLGWGMADVTGGDTHVSVGGTVRIASPGIDYVSCGGNITWPVFVASAGIGLYSVSGTVGIQGTADPSAPVVQIGNSAAAYPLALCGTAVPGAPKIQSEVTIDTIPTVNANIDAIPSVNANITTTAAISVDVTDVPSPTGPTHVVIDGQPVGININGFPSYLPLTRPVWVSEFRPTAPLPVVSDPDPSAAVRAAQHNEEMHARTGNGSTLPQFYVSGTDSAFDTLLASAPSGISWNSTVTPSPYRYSLVTNNVGSRVVGGLSGNVHVYFDGTVASALTVRVMLYTSADTSGAGVNIRLGSYSYGWKSGSTSPGYPEVGSSTGAIPIRTGSFVFNEGEALWVSFEFTGAPANTATGASISAVSVLSAEVSPTSLTPTGIQNVAIVDYGAQNKPLWTSTYRPGSSYGTGFSGNGNALAHALNGNGSNSFGELGIVGTGDHPDVPAFISSSLRNRPKNESSAAYMLTLRSVVEDFCNELELYQAPSKSVEDIGLPYMPDADVIAAEKQLANAKAELASWERTLTFGEAPSMDSIEAIRSASPSSREERKSPNPERKPSPPASDKGERKGSPPAGGSPSAQGKANQREAAQRFVLQFFDGARPDYNRVANWIALTNPRREFLDAVLTLVLGQRRRTDYLSTIASCTSYSAGELSLALVYAMLHGATPLARGCYFRVATDYFGSRAVTGLPTDWEAIRAFTVSWVSSLPSSSYGPDTGSSAPMSHGAGAAPTSTSNAAYLKQKAEAHNQTMHSTNGNIDGWSAVQAASHNRRMHSMNGNPAQNLTVTSASTPHMASPYTWETVHGAAEASSALSTTITDSYVDHNAVVRASMQFVGSIQGAPRLQAVAAAGEQRITVVNNTGALTDSTITSVPASPLTCRAYTTIGPSPVPIEAGQDNTQAGLPIVQVGLTYGTGINIVTSSYGAAVLVKARESQTSQRITALTATYFPFNDEVALITDVAAADQFNPEQMAIKACVDMTRLAWLSPDASYSNTLTATTGRAPIVPEDCNLNRYFLNVRTDFPLNEQYGYTVGTNVPIYPTAVCGKEAYFSLHSALPTAVSAANNPLLTKGQSIPIQLTGATLLSLGNNQIGKVIAIVGSLFAPHPIFPCGYVNSTDTAVFTHNAEGFRTPGDTDLRFYLPSDPRTRGGIPGSATEATLNAMFPEIRSGPCRVNAPAVPGASVDPRIPFYGTVGSFDLLPSSVLEYVGSEDASGSSAYSLTALWASYMNSSNPITRLDYLTVLSSLNLQMPIIPCMKFMQQLVDSRCWMTLVPADTPTNYVPTPGVSPPRCYYDASLPNSSSFTTLNVYASYTRPASRLLSGQAVVDRGQRWVGDATTRFDGPVAYNDPYYPQFGWATFTRLAAASQIFWYLVGRSGEDIQEAATQARGLDVRLIDYALTCDGTRMGIAAGQKSSSQRYLRAAYAAVTGGKTCPTDLAGHSLFGRRLINWFSPSPVFVRPTYIPGVLSYPDLFQIVGALYKEFAPFPAADVLNKSVYLPMGDEVSILTCPAKPDPYTGSAPLYRQRQVQAFQLHTPSDSDPYYDATLIYNIYLWASGPGVVNPQVYTSVSNALVSGLYGYTIGYALPNRQVISTQMRGLWPRKKGSEYTIVRAAAGPTGPVLISEYAQTVNQPRATLQLTPVSARPTAVFNLGVSLPGAFDMFPAVPAGEEPNTSGVVYAQDPSSNAAVAVAVGLELNSGEPGRAPIGVVALNNIPSSSGYAPAGAGGGDVTGGAQAATTVTGRNG